MESTSFQRDHLVYINQVENQAAGNENAVKFEDELNAILVK